MLCFRKKLDPASEFIVLVTGDYNEDVFTDIVCVMEQSDKKLPQAVMLYGQPCAYELYFLYLTVCAQ